MNKKEILQMLATKQITSKEALGLLNSLKEQKAVLSNNILYTRLDWVQEEATLEKEDKVKKNLHIIDLDNRINGLDIIQKTNKAYENISILRGEVHKKHDTANIITFSVMEEWLEYVNKFSECDILFTYSKDQEQNYKILFFLSKTLVKKRINQPICFMVTDIGTDEIDRCHIYACDSFLKALHRESPKVYGKTLELGAMSDDHKLQTIVQELYCKEGGCKHIRYNDRVRYVAKEVEAKLEEAGKKPGIIKSGTYLITGGLGGLGYKFAAYLAKNYQTNLILLGRSKEIDCTNKKIIDLKRLGVAVEYLSVDITNQKDVHNMKLELRKRYTHIEGILHCAGTKEDALMINKTYESFINVIKSKVDGCCHLYEIYKEFSVDMMVLFSSITSILGNVGQCDYAYGNGFLNGFAEIMNSNTSGQIWSLGWPLWMDGGMSVSQPIEAMMKKKYGFELLDDVTGLEAFEKIIKTDIKRAGIFIGDRTKMKDSLKLRENEEKLPSLSKKELVSCSRYDDINLEELKNKTNQFLKIVIQQVTGISQNKMDIRDSFERFGLDSIIAMKINDRLEEDFGDLPKTLMYENQSIEEVSQYLMANYHSELMCMFGVEEHCKEETVTECLDDVKKDKVYIKKDTSSSMDIAIIGLAGRYPKAMNIDEFCQNLFEGRDCIDLIPTSRWDNSKYYCKEKGVLGKVNSNWGGFIDKVDKFDPLFFQIAPREANIMDPQERIFLETAYHALEDAGYHKETLSKYKVGVFVGAMNSHYQQIPSSVKGTKIAHSSVLASVANRVSYHLDLHGPCIALDTMCSSSMTAILLACDSIRKGESQIAIAGGITLILHPDKYLYLAQGGFLSSEGKCRAFGEGGDGYVPSEGAGAVILKPLEQAIEDCDHIYGVIKGGACNHGGRASGFTVPNPKAQAAVIKEALQNSGVELRQINYIEAHGTGTSLGDPIEIAGLMEAYKGEMEGENQRICSIGSVKSNIGHTEAAAGIASLTKVLLQFKHKQLFPSIHTEVLNKNIDFNKTMFHVQQSLSEWKNPCIQKEGKEIHLLRCAGISSFGAGGSNAHLIVEEYEQDILPEAEELKYIILLSAQNEERLRKYVENFSDYIKVNLNNSKVRLMDIAYTLQVGRARLKSRMAMIVSNKQELLEKLETYLNAGSTMCDCFYRDASLYAEGEVDFLEGKEGRDYIHAILKSNNVEALAKLWLMGGTINFDLLYAKVGHRKLSLPTYPFAEERCWLPQEEQEASYEQKGNIIHPLLHENYSDLHGIKFITNLSNKISKYERYYKYNRQGELLSSTLLEMMLEAGKQVIRQEITQIKNMSFGNPNYLIENEFNLTVRAFPNVENVVYQIENGESEIIAEGIVPMEQNDVSTSKVSALELMQKLEKSAKLQDMVQYCNKYGMNVEEACFQIEAYYKSQDSILLQIVLSKNVINQRITELFHLIFASCSYFANDNSIFYPYEISEVSIHRDCTESFWVYIINKNMAEKEFDIQLINIDNQVAIQVSKLILKEMPI